MKTLIQIYTYKYLFKHKIYGIFSQLIKSQNKLNTLRGYCYRNIPNFRKCVFFLVLTEYTCTYSLLVLCKRSNQTPKVLVSRFKYILYDYFDLFLKRRLLKIAKPPVLRTCGNDNSNSRYGNYLKFVKAFLDR